MQIARITDSGDLGRIEPLWLALHHHHQAVAPELAPYVSDEESWRVRRQIYAHLLSSGGVIAVAREDDRDVGYMAAGGHATHWTATFDAPPTVSELVTLLVLPGTRGQGIGSALMDVFDETVGREPALVGVLPQNTRVVQFYERRGFVPAWLTMTRFGRPRTHEPIPVAWEAIAPDEVDQLRPLWLQLHRHHQLVAPGMGTYLDDEASWTAMKGILETGARDGLAFRIGPAAAPVAMMTGSVGRDNVIWSDTWVTHGEIAEPDVLVVSDGARGQGLGSALMDIYDDAVAARGATDQVLAVIAPNAHAIRLYERRGFRPAFLEMTRLV